MTIKYFIYDSEGIPYQFKSNIWKISKGDEMERRQFLQTVGAASLATSISAPKVQSASKKYKYQGGKSPWPLCMNISTIRPTQIEEKIDACGNAGYDAMELWTQDLEKYEEKGKKVEDLRKRIEDHGMFVTDTIGLWDSMPSDETAFQKMMDTNKRRMELARRAGSKHIAVLPLPDRENFDIKQATERYRHILEVGLNEIGIHPAMEFVSVFKGVRRLGEAAQIAIDADHTEAKIVSDTFHMHNGGSGFNGLKHLQGDIHAVFHWNDVPATPPAGQMGDSDRIYPGEGVLPLEEALRDLFTAGFRGPLSLELFRREHWKMDPNIVARDGLKSMRDQVVRALS
jgi:2-keto-myo-inositol isomerase